MFSVFCLMHTQQSPLPSLFQLFSCASTPPTPGFLFLVHVFDKMKVRAKVMGVVVVTILCPGVVWGQLQIKQDALPLPPFSSSLLRSIPSSIPPTATPPPQTTTTGSALASSVSQQSSLWDVMKKNFMSNYKPRPVEKSNEVLSHALSLKSAWNWASPFKESSLNESERNVRGVADVVHNPYALAWDAARVLSKGLASHYWAVPSSGGGWGWKNEVLVNHEHKYLLERVITAKLSIMKSLLLAKLKLHQTLVSSTLPALVKLKINVVNGLIHLLAQKDVNKLIKSIRILNSAIWKGKRKFLCALLGIQDPWASSVYGPVYGPVHSTPSPTYGPIPTTTPHYYYKTSPLKISYGYPSPTPRPDYGYNPPATSPPQPRPDYGYHPAPLLKNPLQAYPQYSSEGLKDPYQGDFSDSFPSLPTLPPVYVPPSISHGARTNDAVLVPSNFLFQLMRSSNTVPRAVSLNNVAIEQQRNSKSPRSNSPTKEAEPLLTPNASKFSSQLLESGFNRTP